MQIARFLAAALALPMLAMPAHAQIAKNKGTTDVVVDCGAFYLIMAGKTEVEDSSELLSQMSDLLFQEADARLSAAGVSDVERERMGGDAVRRVDEQINQDNIGLSFAECHDGLNRAIDALMPDVLSPEARELLICGSQFLHEVQSGEYDAKATADIQVASDDQLARAQTNMERSGVTAEEQDQIAGLFGLSVGMVLGLDQEPLVSWERCGEI
jgi:hypothetical protein